MKNNTPRVILDIETTGLGEDADILLVMLTKLGKSKTSGAYAPVENLMIGWRHDKELAQNDGYKDRADQQWLWDMQEAPEVFDEHLGKVEAVLADTDFSVNGVLCNSASEVRTAIMTFVSTYSTLVGTNVATFDIRMLINKGVLNTLDLGRPESGARFSYRLDDITARTYALCEMTGLDFTQARNVMQAVGKVFDSIPPLTRHASLEDNFLVMRQLTGFRFLTNLKR